MDYDDDENLVCTTGGGELSTASAAQFEAELKVRRAEHTLQSAVPDAMARDADSQALTARTESALSSARRQVVPAGSATRRLSSDKSSRSLHRGGDSAIEDELRSVSNQLKASERAVAQLTQESEKQQKLIASLSSRIERDAHERRELETRMKLLETQLGAAKKEVLLLQRQQATPEDARLQKALQEIEKLRSQVATPAGVAPAATVDGSAEDRRAAFLLAENKKLEAQRTELITCVRKQNKLIDILKRQKIHLEAAKLLQIAEEEFTKMLEINHR